jgi:predicted aldo/keto reductase-like oxidoreductase
MSKLEGSLHRLRTDHVDVYFNHAVNDPARLKNPEWYEFAALAKRQGKLRFTGMSGHGGRLIECLDLALDEDLVDVILAAYNFGQDPAFYERFTKRLDFVAVQPDLPRVLAKARKKGVGVIAMKTLMGAKLNDMRPYERDGATFAQAAFHWVLANPDVDGLIMSAKSRQQIDEYVAASGAASVSRRDLDLLERYVSRHGGSYCRNGCDACESSCPQGVEISNVLRARMYAADYGDPERGWASYAGLATDATACASCRVQSCVAACPHGLKVATLTRSAAELLGQS